MELHGATIYWNVKGRVRDMKTCIYVEFGNMQRILISHDVGAHYLLMCPDHITRCMYRSC